jgi:hypothetical protein
MDGIWLFYCSSMFWIYNRLTYHCHSNLGLIFFWSDATCWFQFRSNVFQVLMPSLSKIFHTMLIEKAGDHFPGCRHTWLGQGNPSRCHDSSGTLVILTFSWRWIYGGHQKIALESVMWKHWIWRVSQNVGPSETGDLKIIQHV